MRTTEWSGYQCSTAATSETVSLFKWITINRLPVQETIKSITMSAATSNYPLYHWIVASTLHGTNGNVNVYDSLYDAIDIQTKDIIANLFGISSIQLIPSMAHKIADYIL